MTSPKAYMSLGRLKNQKSRNLVRGVMGETSQIALSTKTINRLRRSLKPDELKIAIPALYGKGGHVPLNNIYRVFSALSSAHDLDSAPWQSEVVFVASRLNTWATEIESLVRSILELNNLISTSGVAALQKINELTTEWGVSNFLASKVAFTITEFGFDAGIANEFRKYCVQTKLPSFASPYFAMVEAFNRKISYFELVSNWFLSVEKYQLDDFRFNLALHNFIPTPLDTLDVSRYLLKCHTMSFIDEVVCIKVLTALSENLDHVAKYTRACLDRRIVAAFDTLDQSDHDPIAPKSNDEESRDVATYRRSGAFLEYSSYAGFRNYVDKRIARRLAPDRYKLPLYLGPILPVRKARRELTHKLIAFKNVNRLTHPANDGTLLRTVRFLTYLSQFPYNTSFDDFEIKFIFNNTVSLPIFMTAEEIQRIYNLSQGDGRHIIASLAMALRVKKSQGDDANFEFRHHVQQAILKVFSGSIMSFVSWLAQTSPNVAHFVGEMLDRPTLTKMYLIVDSADQANSLRQEILRYLGELTNRIEYFVLADRLKVDALIQSLKHHIDDSRISIDEFAFRKWIDENAMGHVNEYAKLIRHSIDVLKFSGFRTSDGEQYEKVLIELRPLEAFDHFLTQTIKTCFAAFCTNRQFGIESFLSRRIRHNTLRGIMLGSMEAIIQQPRFAALKYDEQFMRSYRTWLDSYEYRIEILRSELLQFKTERLKDGLFVSDIDTTSELFSNALARMKVFSAMGEANEAISEHIVQVCWNAFAVQLEAVVLRLQSIRSDILMGVDNSYADDEVPVRSFCYALKEVIREKFDKLASWFRVPDSNAVSATIYQISELVRNEGLEHNPHSPLTIDFAGNALHEPLLGLSVHRVYDSLFVLVSNAFKYAHPSAAAKFLLNIERPPASTLPWLSVTATSRLGPGRIGDKQFRDIQELLHSTEDLSLAMVREGYTGIRRIRYLLTITKSETTLKATRDQNILTIRFLLPIEIVEKPK